MQWNCSQTGAFAEQIDPATLAPIGAPIAAPGTLGNADATSLLGLDDRVALTGRPGLPGVYMAYKTPDENEVRLWRVGDPTAKSIKKRRFVREHY